MPSLQSLNLDTNSLSGAIPPCISNLTTSPAVFLQLGSNQFSGTLPAALGAMSTLFFLDLSNNLLSGTLPSSFNSLNNLMVMCVSWGAMLLGHWHWHWERTPLTHLPSTQVPPIKRALRRRHRAHPSERRDPARLSQPATAAAAVAPLAAAPVAAASIAAAPLTTASISTAAQSAATQSSFVSTTVATPAIAAATIATPAIATTSQPAFPTAAQPARCRHLRQPQVLLRPPPIAWPWNWRRARHPHPGALLPLRRLPGASPQEAAAAGVGAQTGVPICDR